MSDTALAVSAATLPDDLSGKVRSLKQAAREQIRDVEGLFKTVEAFIQQEVEDIESVRSAGGDVWPQVEYDDMANGRVTDEQIQYIKRRGCAMIRNHFPHERALEWDRSLVSYLDENSFDSIYRGPADDFFGSLSASRPPILPIYWSHAQMQARQDERMAEVQSFMNRLWAHQSEGQTWFDPDRNLLYRTACVVARRARPLTGWVRMSIQGRSSAGFIRRIKKYSGTF